MITKKTKVYGLSSLLFFIVALCSVLFIWQFVYSEGEKLLDRTKEIADFNAREQTYRDLKSLVDATKKDREELNGYILTEETTTGFLSTIEQLAKEQGVDLVTESLKDTKETGLFNTLVISYSVGGTQQRIHNILLMLETLPYNSSITSVSLHASPEKGSNYTNGSIELTLSLLNYDR